MTNGPLSRPIVPPAREGHRRAFSNEEKRSIVEESALPGASLSAVARRYGIAARVLFRWKQELAPGRCSSRCRSPMQLYRRVQWLSKRSTCHDAASCGRGNQP